MAKFAKIDNKKIEIEYVDNRPIFFPGGSLTYYPRGYKPKTGDVMTVTENEKKKLLKLKNGKNPCWKIKQRRSDSGEVKDGSR